MHMLRDSVTPSQIASSFTNAVPVAMCILSDGRAGMIHLKPQGKLLTRVPASLTAPHVLIFNILLGFHQVVFSGDFVLEGGVAEISTSVHAGFLHYFKMLSVVSERLSCRVMPQHH